MHKPQFRDRAGLDLQALPLKLAKGRGAAAACVAVVYKACALEGYPRTFKELLAVVPEANTRKVCSLPLICCPHQLCVAVCMAFCMPCAAA